MAKKAQLKSGIEPVGLIAGSGRLPFLVARGMLQTGRPLVTVGFIGLASRRLRALSDVYRWTSIVRPGQWIRTFKRHDVHEVVMVGGVEKRAIYTPMRLFRYVPDLRAAKIWYVRLRKDKRDNAVLISIADELRSEGIELVSSVKYCKEHLADEGLMTHKPLPRGVQADVEFGWHIARASADLDIGQSLAVKERDIIAVEAMEGTDAMIRRAGRVCRRGAWIMVKVARPKQDMRFDVPTIGQTTIRNLKDAKCTCLVVEAGRTLIVDKPVTIALADELGIAVIGKAVEPDEGRQ